MDKYKDFATEDFVTDEKFQDWVLKSDPVSNSYWNNWLAEHPQKQEEVGEARRLILQLKAGIEVKKLSPDDFISTWQHIQKKKNQRIDPRFRIRKVVARVAAVLIGMAVMGYGVFQFNSRGSNEIVVQEAQSGITLELQDGTVVALDESKSGIITIAGGKDLARQNQQELVYDGGSGVNSGEEEELVYNTLTVPYGKKFEVALSDGTHVHLNAGSSLRYPVRFLSQEPRDVFLDGEAYFTVAPDAVRPFTVHTTDMETRVYGTQFNVSSYQNDDNTFTVLVEGSVSVFRGGKNAKTAGTILKPGQRAIYEGGEIDVEEADVDKYTAWIEGKLLFTDDRFELILKKLERHFDVTIENQFSELENRRFTGTFRNETLDQILAVFIAHTPFVYGKEGDTIIIRRANTKSEGD